MNLSTFLLARAAHQIESKLVLKDYTKFAPVVAKAYEARPIMEDAAIPSWEVAVAFVEKQFRQTESRLPIEFVDYDPYTSYEDMEQKVAKEKVLKVWTGASDKHPLWTPEQNWKFRAIHDYQSHLSGNHSFGLKGEIASYNRHIKTFPRAAWPCLYTEIVGQTSVTVTTGDFPTQKVALLYGFDFQNVGTIDETAYQKNFEADNAA